MQQGVTSVGLLATDGTLKAGFYPRELGGCGIDLKVPEPSLQQQVMEGIYRVKSGAVEEGGKLLERCMDAMLRLGVDRVILGCTEIPLALDRIDSTRSDLGMDATLALAAACVQWHMQQQCSEVA
jgi:aspartate racemase